MAYDLIFSMGILCIVALAWPACGQAVRAQQSRAHARRSADGVTRGLRWGEAPGGRRERASAGAATSPPTGVRPAAGRPRGLIIVAPDQRDLWASLRNQLAATDNVLVFFDRRQGERRSGVQTYGTDRRGADRRRPPSRETDVRSRQYVIVRPRQ